jgi:hypothetical protein
MAGSGQGFGVHGGDSPYMQTAPSATQYDGGRNLPTYGNFGSGMGNMQAGQQSNIASNNLYPQGVPPTGIPQPGIHQPGMPQQYESFPGVNAMSAYSPQIQSLPTNAFQGAGMQELSAQAFNPFIGPVAPVQNANPSAGAAPFPYGR